jgi:hypothetical protein
VTIPTEDIRLGEWDEKTPVQRQGQHALFNSLALANANQLEGHTPFVLEVSGNHYLAYKRHASAVLGGLSLEDEVALLENIPALRKMLAPMGIRNLSLNTLNAAGDLDALARAICLGCKVRFEYMLDLEEYSSGKISSNHKRNIKKSEKAGAKVVLPTELEAMQSHIELVNTNLGNKGVGGISSSAGFLSYLIQEKSGLLVQVIEDEELLASTYFITNQDSAYYHSSGTSDRGKKIGAAHFLVDRMIAEMRERNMRYLNLGGCTSEQVGLQRFKVGFRPHTRVLASSSQQLALTGKQKIRSILSTKARAVFSVERVTVYKKPLPGSLPVNAEGYTFEELAWETLVKATAEAPELSDSLGEFCRSNPYSYSLSDQHGKLMAIGFLERKKTGGSSSTGRNPASEGAMEITGLRFINGALDDGVGTTLISYLEQQVHKLGFTRIVSRVDYQDVELRELLLAAGFSFAGEEKIISTAIWGGGSRVLGRVDT